MMDENGKGFPSWSQMDDTGKGIVVLFSLGGIPIILNALIKLYEWISVW